MTTLSVADVLDRAADLIEPEGAWTQGAYAKTADGNHFMHGDAAGAVCWCAIGAIDKASASQGRDHPNYLWLGAARQLADILPQACGLNDTITTFNDDPGRTQAEVVAKLREAATLSRSSENRNG